jgi:putative phosphoesterase
MRVAVVSDIHGNWPALRAVLVAIARDAPEAALWCTGDFVGYGPWPDECVRAIAGRGGPSVSGNYDEKVLKFARKQNKWRNTKDPRKFRAFEHAHENLSAESRDYLAALPCDYRTVIGGHRVLMTHIAPDSHEAGLHPLTPPPRLTAIAATAGADVIVSGHTHWPLVRREAGVLFVNAGSVGRPGDGDTRAAYVLLTLRPGAPPEAEIRRVAYPVHEVIAALAPAGLPPDFAGLYQTGRATF